MHIGLLLFPRLTQLDLTGPFEVFANTPGATVHLLWKSLDPVRAITGMAIVPDTTLADCPQLDVVCVPGGSGVAEVMEDPEVLDFLRRQAADAPLCHVGLHGCPGSRRGWVAARQTRDHSLGIA